MKQLFTKNIDTENYLIEFLDVCSIFNYAKVSTMHYHFIKKNILYQQLIRYKKRYKNYDNLIDWTSQNGYLNILNWFKNSGLEFEYTNNAIDWASKNGHIHILNWFKNSGLEF